MKRRWKMAISTDKHVAGINLTKIFDEGIKILLERRVQELSEPIIKELKSSIDTLIQDTKANLVRISRECGEEIRIEILDQLSVMDPYTRFKVMIDIVDGKKEEES
jgi:hypothetical protein